MMTNLSKYSNIKNPCSEIILDMIPIDDDITNDIVNYFKNVLINIKSRIIDVPEGLGYGRAILKINPIRIHGDPIYQLELEFICKNIKIITTEKTGSKFLQNIESSGYRYIPRSTKITGNNSISMGFKLPPDDFKYLENCITECVIQGTRTHNTHYFDFNL